MCNSKSLSKKKVDIVIIDSGVRCNHPLFADMIFDGISIINKSGNYCVSKEFNDSLGHGTAVCGIIKNNTKVLPNLFNVKIYSEDLNTDCETLVFALNYIMKYIDCKIIHMSLGTLWHNNDLEKACLELAKKGVILVSAFDNSGGVSYPAAYSSVIGVDVASICNTTSDYVFLENNIVNVLAKGGAHRVAWTKPDYTIVQGTSFSAAYVTSKLFNYLSNSEVIDAIAEFKKDCRIINTHSMQIANNPFYDIKIKKAAIFPYNKETTSLLNYADELTFDLIDICSSKYLGNIGKCVNSIDHKKSYIIKDIDVFKWESIDTFIIGHCDISNYSKINYKDYILKKCLDHNVNVYSFDKQGLDNFRKEFSAKGLTLYTPGEEYSSDINFTGKLHALKTPVLCVMGTSSVQGKFTLQLMLRKEFKRRNYTVGQLGSEPSSFLFGMDRVYPYGFNSNVCFNSNQSVELINNMMHEIDIKDYDIILAGGQSGTIPMCFNNIRYLNIEQITFLMGVNPDAIILCVNTFDPIDYIERTISAIEGITDAKVIALAVSVMGFPNDIHIANNMKKAIDMQIVKQFALKLNKIFDKATYIIGVEEQAKQLVDTCIEYLSSEEEGVIVD